MDVRSEPRRASQHREKPVTESYGPGFGETVDEADETDAPDENILIEAFAEFVRATHARGRPGARPEALLSVRGAAEPSAMADVLEELSEEARPHALETA